MMTGVSEQDGGRKNAAKGNTRQDQEEQQQLQAGDIDTSTHASLAAMSTDDVSSMGETQMTYYTGTTSGSRRKRKDDCSESRCTVTSEESARSRSRPRRCRSVIPDQHRWLDRIDRKAATSHAPIRPNRSDDDGFLFPPPTEASASAPTSRFTSTALAAETGFAFQRSVSHTLPRPGVAGVNSCSPLRSSNDASTALAREVARCQSMSLPPVRPTRTRDDSKTDLMKEDSKTDLMKAADNDQEDAEKNEIDPDMFVRLLSGQQVAAGLSNAADPPKKPKRRNDADVYRDENRTRSPNTLMRFNTMAPNRGTAVPSSNRACPHKCQSMRHNCPHDISPKPPAKPFRTFDDSFFDSAGGIPQAAGDLSLPLLPKVPRVSEKGPALMENLTSGKGSDRQNEMSSSNMDLEPAEDEGAEVVQKNDGVEQEAVEDQDEREVSIPTSVKEYDPDLFARLLSGEAAAKESPSTDRTTQGVMTEDPQPPPPLLARGSSSSAKPSAPPAHPGYNRFDNSAPCAIPEHLEGAMKSSHPPMRPRRSFDEGRVTRNDMAVSLANAAAVACVVGASTSSILAEPVKPRICIIGGKRRYVRQPRRSTLALASELPPADNSTAVPVVATETIDPTHDFSLVAPPALYAPFGSCDETDEENEDAYMEPIVKSDGSYQRIVPARRHRRVVRRFTMPSKGRDTSSPQSKKRRTIGRSLSCRSSEDGITPAA